MAITRRQFVTRMGTLAAAMGLSQVDLAKVTEVFAHSAVNDYWYQKPRVIWVHGAECTGCSTSVLGLFEDVGGQAIVGASYTTAAALDLAVGGDGDGGDLSFQDAYHPFGHRTLQLSSAATDSQFEPSTSVASIADVLVDFISLEYHETVNGMAGDLAYQFLDERRTAVNTPFVLVVEGASQDHTETGAWNDVSATNKPWCAIGMNEASTLEHSFDEVVEDLAGQKNCVAVVCIGQCATFGGYPACESPTLAADPLMAKTDGTVRQTPARGTYDHLVHKSNTGAAKVVNVPGCPTNPWWFTLSVVALLIELATCGSNEGDEGALHILRKAAGANPDYHYTIVPSAVDASRRLKAVYGTPLHGPACTRYQDSLYGVMARYPGDRGCLQLLGCKGPSTNSLCAAHGWNAQQPQNNASWDAGLRDLQGVKGGNCIAGGHPCMGCTEQGYPDYMVPFVVRR